MKKIYVFVLALALTVIFNCKVVKANCDYTAFQEINFAEEGKKFLSEITEEELKEYYKETQKAKFMGWNTYTITKSSKVKYIDETVFTCKNEGKTAVVYKIQFKEEEISKRSFSVTGNLSIDVDNKVKKLKAGLDAKLKIEYSESSTLTKRTDWYTKTDVDPGTKLTVDIVGEGYIENGVASKYFFFINTKNGGYEIFTIATEYYRLEKTQIC